MPEINTDDKVVISFKGRTEIYDGVIFAAVTSMEEVKANESAGNDEENTEVVKVDLVCLGTMAKEEILLMEQKLLRETWRMWTNYEKAEIFRTLQALVAFDEAREAKELG